jgi:hypothetical protein
MIMAFKTIKYTHTDGEKRETPEEVDLRARFILGPYVSGLYLLLLRLHVDCGRDRTHGSDV